MTEMPQERQEKNTSGRDWGKPALFIALLAMLLTIVLFYGVNQNLTGLSKQVQELERTTQQQMGEKVQSMEQRLASLENTPEKNEAVLVESRLAEMLFTVRFLKHQAPDKVEDLKRLETVLQEMVSGE